MSKDKTIYNRQYTCTWMQWAVWFTVGVWPLYSQLDKHVTFKNIQNATSLSKNTKEGTVASKTA